VAESGQSGGAADGSDKGTTMPLYEYTCRGCSHTFEALVRHGSIPECPSCHGQDLERLLSMFAVASDATRTANLQSRRRDARKDQTERAVAAREEIDHHHH
jgi:putative FmdB family regulatory protein